MGDDDLRDVDAAGTPADEAPQRVGLEARLVAIVSPPLVAMGYDLVRLVVLGRDVPTVQVMADRADGSLISIEDCEAITHMLSPLIDVHDPMPGRWHLEVSSAGIDRPLTRRQDWERFAGHLARAEFVLPVEGRRRVSGIIMGIDADTVRLRLDDGADFAFPLADLRRAKLVLTDSLIAATAPATPSN